MSGDGFQGIERVAHPTPRLFYELYVKPNKPVILAGITDTWKAISSWTPDYFRSHYADASVMFTAWESSEPSNDPTDYYRNRKRLGTRLGRFIDLMNSELDFSRNYISQFPVFQVIPQLRDDIGSLDSYMNIPPYYPEPLATRLKKEPTLWFGPAGTVTPVHFDSAHNLLVQIHGRKKLLLIPPRQSRSLYYPRLDLGHVNYSPVDVEAPDLQRFPLFKDVRPLEVCLEPGEVLFIPVRWWHYARALDVTISLNFWWFSADSLRRMWHPYFIYKRSRLLKRLRSKYE
ncbi:MAG: cupin-like domain-containing protein [Acidobacteriota bacterium]